LFVFGGLVVLGLASGAGLFRWQANKLTATAAWVETNPDSPPAERLRYWFLKYGQPQLHHSLLEGRWSEQKPWLLTHIAQPLPLPNENYAPELWGIDLAGVGIAMASLDGMQVRIQLPAPRLLERTQEIPGRVARGIPIYKPGEALPPLSELARHRVQAFLSPVMTALDRKLPGVELWIQVGTEPGQRAVPTPVPAAGT
jgi:hypothetical protein